MKTIKKTSHQPTMPKKTSTRFQNIWQCKSRFFSLLGIVWHSSLREPSIWSDFNVFVFEHNQDWMKLAWNGRKPTGSRYGFKKLKGSKATDKWRFGVAGFECVLCNFQNTLKFELVSNVGSRMLHFFLEKPSRFK